MSDDRLTPLSDSGRAISRVLLENPLFQDTALRASQLGQIPHNLGDIPVEKAVENALVNVFCQLRTEDYTRTTTGSGFFIDPDGVILTNAHVAQFLLLTNVDPEVIDTRCVIRSGNPATPQYEAELLYLSPTWILDNASLLTAERPQGTGERDFALLYVARAVDNQPLPARFPALPFTTELMPRTSPGTSIVSAGYPAEALFREGARARLIPVVATTTISELYTFGSNFADIFSVFDSPVGAEGASGGPITTTQGTALGLIVTKGDEVTEGERSLRALTLSYIDRTITAETGFSLAANMSGDLPFRSAVYSQALAPFLSQLLVNELD
jgi:hypothetical protein